MEPIPYGYTWSHKANKWSYSEDLADQELNNNMTPEQKTKSTLLTIMNGIQSDLNFTVESKCDYPNLHLPTLDCKLSLIGSNDGTTNK